MVRDPEIHYDGGKIVFSMRDDWDDNHNLFEINADGSGLKQLTSADRVTDIHPAYLPDNSIVFTSTREPKYVMCNRHIMANLFRMEGDGANIHQISKNTLFDYFPQVLPDGRIQYTRWEYVDRNFGDANGLWTCTPDGRNHELYFANNTISPGAVINSRPIWGTDLVVCIFGSCHDRPWGALAIIDRSLGVDLPQPGRSNPVKHIWPPEAIDLCGGQDGTKPIPGGIYGIDNFGFKRVNPKYEDPWPLYDKDVPESTGKYFLVSRSTGKGEDVGIYLLDIFGNEILLHYEAPGCYDPMPLAPRRRPFMLADEGTRKYDDPGKGEGKVFVTNVYEGTHMEGVQPGEIKWLRVVESPEKRYRNITHLYKGQGVHGPGMNWHDFNNKRILGTVPVEKDGSAFFKVPADRFVFFQLLDENKMMVQSMRSGTMAQSGETMSCIGCHDSRTYNAPVTTKGSLLALQRKPSLLTGWMEQPQKEFNYLKEVQPVFDAKCVSCHDIDGGVPPILAGDQGPVFNASYRDLWRQRKGMGFGGYTGVVGGGYAPIQQAKSWGSHKSKLIATIKGNSHYDVKLTDEEFVRIATWIDLNAPYYPVYACAYPNQLAGRSPLNDSQLKQLKKWSGLDVSKAGDYRANQEVLISFDRPEKSPLLKRISDPAERETALSIIKAGQKQLQNLPRAEMPGFVPNPDDLAREEKYQMRLSIEARNRKAIREGRKEYD